MVQLTLHQSHIGQLLQRGNLLLRDRHLNDEEERGVEAQMALLNAQWEGLRVEAMTRQTR